jgi:predicted permease
VWQDIRVAWRFLLKRRTATAVTILTLGIAVGVCALAVSAFDGAFWRSIESPDGATLITFYKTRPAAPQFQVLSYPEYIDLRDQLRETLDVAAFFRTENTLGGDAGPARVRGELVSPNYFQVLRAKPFAGQLLGADSGQSSAPSIVLSYDFWAERFGRNPAVIGMPVRLGQREYTLVGIAEKGFHGPAYPSKFWLPLAMTQSLLGEDLAQAQVPYLQTVARPREATTAAQVRGRMQILVHGPAKDGWRLVALPGSYLRFWPAYRPAIRRFLTVFVGLGLGILTIACINVAGLLLARSSERQRELALRQALGGTRLQLLRRLAAESMVITALGGTIGLVLAFWGARWVEHVPLPVPAPVGVTLDARLAVIAIGVSLVSSLLFTTMSAWKGLRSDVQAVLSATAGSPASRPTAGRLLVIGQVTLSCVMLIAGGLLLRSLWNVNVIDVGFDASNRVTGMVDLSDQGYTTTRARLFYQRLRDHLLAHVQVQAVAFEWNAVLAPVRGTARFLLPGRSEPVQARFNVVSSGYFNALDIPLRAGREFTSQDVETAQPVAIVNDRLAALLDGPAVGQILRSADGSPTRIVGVVRDVKYNGITEPSQPFVYLSAGQVFRPDMHVYLAMRSSPADGLALLRAELRALDPNVALSEAGTLTAQLDEARTVPRAAAVVSCGLAGIAVFLAVVGMYGVMATSIQSRQRELAIRSALGATRGDIIKRVVWEGAILTAIGLACGLLGSLAMSRVVSDLLFGVAPHDAWVFIAAPSLVFAASAMAWLAPARRAARIDPATLLRAQ